MNVYVTIVALLGLARMSQADLGNSSPPNGACLCVTARGLNIRVGGGTSHGVIKLARNGECFKYTGQTAWANGYTWYRIDVNGQAGWAAGTYLNLGSPSQCQAGPPQGACLCVTASRLNIRSTASTSGRILNTASRGQCYKYTGQRQSGNGIFWLSLDLNGQGAWAAEEYLSIGQQAECLAKNNTYEGCTGNGRVDYRSFTVSDQKVKDKLEKIADYFCTRLYLTSGDRSGTERSLHNVKRAADFWLDGFSVQNTDAVNIWNGLRASGLFNDEAWEVIWHGPHTCTGGIHFHVGRYAYSRSTCFKKEGTTTANVCDYQCHPL